MENIGLIIFPWLLFSILIGFLGKKKNIGFGGAFFLSILLSPLIGLIIALSSKEKKDIKEEYKFLEYLELAKKEDFKGQYEKAIDHYMDALYHLENDYKNLKNQKLEAGRKNHIKSIKEKIEMLKQKQNQPTT